MVSDEYQHGDMDIADQRKTWSSFIKASTVGSILTLLVVGYLTFVFAAHMHWAVALGIVLIAGGITGYLMKLGMGWIMTLGAFAVTVVIVRILMAIFGALM